MANREEILENNFTVLYEDGLDGGGILHLPDFHAAVSSTGRNHYTSAVEWCAGFGVIGFDFLNKGICDRMSFIDCHEPAIKWLNETAIYNSVEDLVHTYLSEKISNIPANVKWDLVLANPPHAFDVSTKIHFEETVQQPQLDDVVRITCDVDFQIHREFFKNIRTHLLPGADIFISEVAYMDEIEQMAIEAGLSVVARNPAPMLSINSNTEAVVIHFKEPL